jgi:hypothetical protein
MPDVVLWWGNAGSRQVGWILGSTSGALSLSPGFNMTGTPLAITMGDFNNDTANDIAIAYGENSEQHLRT